MKNLLFFACFCFSTSIFSQTTSWFLPGASWSYDYYSLVGFGTEILENAGTQMVGGELCTKIHRHGIRIGTPLAGPFDYGYEYLFARNDSVFLWDQNSFRLLHDFTLQTGDTMWLTSSPNQFAVVQATGDTSWQGIPVRYQDWMLVSDFGGGNTFFTPTRVYERLGGHHLIYWDIQSPLTEIYYELQCYSDVEYPSLDCIPDSAYTYFPLRWNVRWSERDGSFCGFDGYQYVLGGDTFVLGYSWSKNLYYRRTYQGSDPCPTATAEMLNEPLVLIGAISQDLIRKKVYYTAFTAADVYPANLDPNYHFQPGVTTLLYDFDLEPAQILDWKPEPRMYAYSDSIQLNNGSWRRRLFFHDSNGGPLDTTYYLLEGIGGSHGLFTGFVNPKLLDVYSGLRCFKEQNTLLLNEVPVEYCDSIPIIIAAPERPSLEAQIQLYPNPASGQVTLEIPAEALPAMLILYDPLGRVLKTLEVSSPRTSVPLDISGQDWLLVQIRSWDGRAAGRKVKM